MPPVIEFEGVCKRFGNIQAVDHVSFRVEKSEIVALLGASGCGKTTTLRLLAGLESPEAGQIWLNDELIASPKHWTPPEDRAIGMVFQDYALFPHLNLEANIAFPLNQWKRRERQARVAELLQLIGLEDMGKRFPHQISGGQAQRVALARALAPRPSVILLDEPFSNLDAALRKSTREDVHDILKAANTTAIFVTHDQDEAMSISDRIGMMQGGCLIQMGTPRELYETPASPDVALFLGEANRLTGQANGQTATTVLGEIALSKPHHGAVDVFIRPENLIIDPEGSIAATITRVSYFGARQTLHLRLNDGINIEMNTPTHRIYTPQQTLRLRVSGHGVAFDQSTQ